MFRISRRCIYQIFVDRRGKLRWAVAVPGRVDLRQERLDARFDLLQRTPCREAATRYRMPARDADIVQRDGRRSPPWFVRLVTAQKIVVSIAFVDRVAQNQQGQQPTWL